MEIDLTMVAIISPLVIALVEVAKRTGMPSKWGGAAAVVCGLVLAMLYALATGTEPMTAVFAGLVAGLTGAGVYSGQKAARSPF